MVFRQVECGMRKREKSRLVPKFGPQQLEGWSCCHLRYDWNRLVGNIRVSVEGMEILRCLADIQMAKGNRELGIYLSYSRYLINTCWAKERLCS